MERAKGEKKVDVESHRIAGKEREEAGALSRAGALLALPLLAVERDQQPAATQQQHR